MSTVEGYYDANAAVEWERLEQQRTEFAVTLRALSEYLPTLPATILDIGGGPGRYAITLAQQGYSVTLLDLSSNCLQFAQAKAQEAGVTLAGYLHGNALDLAQMPDAHYDSALLLGPLYHLLTAGERACAVAEAARVLKPGGRIFAAFITRYTPIRWGAKFAPELILEVNRTNPDFLETGLMFGRDERAGFSLYCAHPAEIRPVLEQSGFETLDLIACEGIVSMIDEQLNTLTGEAWQAWVEQNYRIGKDPSVHGAAEHLLYVGQKR